jgi:hypothetical protein
MSRQTPEEDAESVSPLSADDLGLESLEELGAPLLLIKDVATEVVGAAEHVRSAATSVLNALTYLSDSDSGQVASSGTGSAPGSTTTSADGAGSLNPLTAVTDALGDVLDAARGRPSARDKEQPASDPPKSATRTTSGEPAADGSGSIDPSDADLPASGVGRRNLPATGILGANTLTDMVGKVIDTAAKPVGEGLRQAQRIAAAPLAGINDVLEKVVGTGARDETDALRKRGNTLIRISYKPDLQRRDVHPSFSHILDELLPDEARILRFLGVAGPQPMIDVRTKTLLQIGSILLVGGVSAVASMAGCHWPDRDQHYFANLNRLGLIDLSREPVDDYRRYALLEVQPVALHAIESVSKALTIYRSITLTAFGRQFIDVCINTNGYNAGGWDTDGRQDKIRGKRTPDDGSQNRKHA